MQAWTNIAATLLLAMTSALPAQAGVILVDQGAYVGHQVDCFGLLFSDPAAHGTECGGPFTLPDTNPKSIGGGSYGPGCTYTTAIDPKFDNEPRLGTTLLVAQNCCPQASSYSLPNPQNGPIVLPVVTCDIEEDIQSIQG